MKTDKNTLFHPQFRPVVTQLKTVVSTHNVERRVAPLAYRPPATLKVVQPKIVSGALNRKPPVAPHVYRPQPVPKVLQTKKQVSQTRPPAAD